MGWFTREKPEPPKPRRLTLAECINDPSVTVAEIMQSAVAELGPVTPREYALLILAVTSAYTGDRSLISDLGRRYVC